MKPLRGIQLDHSHPLARGLFGCWLLNEGSGDRVHDIAEGYQGILYNDISWQPDKAGLSLRFGGNGDYIQFAVHEPRCNAATGFSWATRLMFWKLPSVAGANAYGPSYQTTGGYAWTLYGQAASDTLRASIRDASVNNLTSDSLGSITVGRWFDVAGTFDGAVLSLYVDGAFVQSLEPGSVLGGTGLALQWGLGGSLGYASPEANVEYCMFWDRALTDSEARRVTMDPYCMFEQHCLMGV